MDIVSSLPPASSLPDHQPRLAIRMRRWFLSAALALILAAIEVGGERPMRLPTPIILLREEEFSRRFPRIRPYRAHYRRHTIARAEESYEG